MMFRRKRLSSLLLPAVLAVASPAIAGEASRSTFGKMPDGAPVASVTLKSGKGVSVRVIAYGASLQQVLMRDRSGATDDIAVGYDTFQPYLDTPQYFGATVGRVANRIAKGRFVLDGKTYTVPVNNGPNSLHGGARGFDKVLWEVVDVKSGPVASVTMRYVSRDGDQGYPGTLTAYATYSLDEQNQLTIEYRATTNSTTVVNLSNHAYWNLGGVSSPQGAMGTVLSISAERYTPTDATAIPVGRHASVEGTPFDFRQPRPIELRVRDARNQQIVFGHGYDHNWVVGEAVTSDTHLMARAVDPLSGRGFELWSNQPGLQFYSGNFLDGTSVGKGGKLLRMGDAFVLEPQVFPDAVNQPGYPSVTLQPGQTYRNVMIYKFTATPVAPTAPTAPTAPRP